MLLGKPRGKPHYVHSFDKVGGGGGILLLACPFVHSFITLSCA